MITSILSALAVAAVSLPSMSAKMPLTAEGWGELKIGMTEAEAARRFSLMIPSSDDGVSSEACRELRFPKGGPPLVVMTEAGLVTRISTFRRAAIRTDRGFGVGSREADIRKAYGRTLKIEPHKYAGEPAHYLTVWTKPEKRGVRYETDEKGVVTVVHVGGPSIQYIEGCL